MKKNRAALLLVPLLFVLAFNSCSHNNPNPPAPPPVPGPNPPNPPPPPPPNPQSDNVTIQGNVYVQGATKKSLFGAVVATSLDAQTAVTGGNGTFSLMTNTKANYSKTPYTITITAGGYQSFSQSNVWGDHPENQEFYLVPLPTPPPTPPAPAPYSRIKEIAAPTVANEYKFLQDPNHVPDMISGLQELQRAFQQESSNLAAMQKEDDINFTADKNKDNAAMEKEIAGKSEAEQSAARRDWSGKWEQNRLSKLKGQENERYFLKGRQTLEQRQMKKMLDLENARAEEPGSDQTSAANWGDYILKHSNPPYLISLGQGIEQEITIPAPDVKAYPKSVERGKKAILYWFRDASDKTYGKRVSIDPEIGEVNARAVSLDEVTPPGQDLTLVTGGGYEGVDVSPSETTTYNVTFFKASDGSSVEKSVEVQVTEPAIVTPDVRHEPLQNREIKIQAVCQQGAKTTGRMTSWSPPVVEVNAGDKVHLIVSGPVPGDKGGPSPDGGTSGCYSVSFQLDDFGVLLPKIRQGSKQEATFEAAKAGEFSYVDSEREVYQPPKPGTMMPAVVDLTEHTIPGTLTVHANIPPGGNPDGTGARTAGGKYSYDPDEGEFVLTVTNSDFICEGPEAGKTETFTLSNPSPSTMKWVSSKNSSDILTWSRGASASGITGTWTMSSPSGNSYSLTLNSNDSWSMTGNILKCQGQSKKMRAESQHWSNGYYVHPEYDDNPKSATSVTVTGPGINGSLGLVYDTTWNNWSSWSLPDSPVYFGANPPSTPLTYTFTIKDANGTRTETAAASCVMQPFASNLSVTKDGTGKMAFNWTKVPDSNVRYSVELNNPSAPNSRHVWDNYDLGDVSSAIYGGPSLTTGITYEYLISVRTQDGGCSSFAMARFILNPDGTVTNLGQDSPDAQDQLNIPVKTISVDGNSSDWSGVSALASKAQASSSLSGSSVKAVYAAKDSSYLYLRMDLFSAANTNFGNGPAPYGGRYNFNIESNSSSNPSLGLGLAYRYCGDHWSLGCNGSNDPSLPQSLQGTQYVGVNGNVIEVKVPLSSIGNPTAFYGISAEVNDCCVHDGPPTTLDSLRISARQ